MHDPRGTGRDPRPRVEAALMPTYTCRACGAEHADVKDVVAVAGPDRADWFCRDMAACRARSRAKWAK